MTVTDPQGDVVGTSTESFTAGAGTATAFVDLAQQGSAPGRTLSTSSGDYAVSDPDTLDPTRSAAGW